MPRTIAYGLLIAAAFALHGCKAASESEENPLSESAATGDAKSLDLDAAQGSSVSEAKQDYNPAPEDSNPETPTEAMETAMETVDNVVSEPAVQNETNPVETSEPQNESAVAQETFTTVIQSPEAQGAREESECALG